MYAPEVVEARLAEAQRASKTPHAPIPSYSVDDSHALTERLAAAVSAKGTFLRSLTREESAFIAATQIRSACDFRYFAERFVWIDQSGQGVRPLLPLWESQAFVLSTLARLERARAQTDHPDGLLLNVLKARQLGISTLAEALVAHRLLTGNYVRALCGADVEDQAGYLFRMVDRLYQHLPWFLRPARATFVKNREMTFANQSYLKTAWGKSTRGALQAVTGVEGSKGAIGRGQTFSVVHISELATWDNPEQLDTALFPAVPIDPSTLLLLESTAEVAGDWWHQHWQTAAGGDGRFVNVFIPWYAEPARYALPPPLDWSPAPTTLQMATRCELDSPRWFEGRTITLSRAQLYWYERTRAYYAAKGELGKFLKEYPADDAECFQYSGASVFTIEQLAQIDAAATRPLLDVWAVEPAREIAELRRLRPEDEPGPRQRPLPPLTPRLPGTTLATAASAIPVPPGYGFRRLTPAQLPASLRASVLAIWEYPRVRGRRRYVLSADVSDGLGQDYSVVDVIRLPTIEEPCEQVAQYVSNTVNAQTLAFVIDAIGRYYHDEDGVEALVAIETNNHGLSTQDTLQLHLGYGSFYVWEYADSASPERRFSTKIGWVTTPRTRPLLLSAFHDAIVASDAIDGRPDFVLNSPLTRGELRHFITPDVLANAAAARGQHDDCVMAAAIGYYVAWRLSGGESEPISERRRRRTALQQEIDRQGAEIIRPDWRNTATTAEEADRAVEDDDAFADDESAPLHFDARAHDDG